MCNQIITIDNRVAGFVEPLATRNPDGTITLDWQGDTKLQCLASHELIQRMVDDHNATVRELTARRAVMKHADDLGIDVAAVTRLICPPVCETCKGQFDGKMPGWKYGSNWDWVPCPECHGRSRHTLHDRIEELRYADSDGPLDRLLADVAKVTP